MNSDIFPRLRARPAHDAPGAALPVTLDHDTWPAFWRQVQSRLRGHGYARSTILFYRHIVRAFSRQAGKSPRAVTAADLHAYMSKLTSDRCTWHWTAMNLSVLRTLFDKIGGLNALHQRRGPRRKRRLPDYLDRSDIVRLMDAAANLRDQLAIALLYGCGLKTSELRRLVWRDIDPEKGTLRVPSRWGPTDRLLPIPVAVRDLLREGQTRCAPDQPVFCDPAGKKPLSSRRIQTLIRETACRAGIEKAVLPVTLRHSHAVHFLQDGGTIRQLQENLDHRYLETTARYLDITGLPDRTPPPPPIIPISIPIPTPPSPPFWQQLTDRFIRKIRGLRLFANTA